MGPSWDSEESAAEIIASNDLTVLLDTNHVIPFYRTLKWRRIFIDLPPFFYDT